MVLPFEEKILSIIIPCYNSAENIIRNLEILAKKIDKKNDVEIDIIIINDGSTDELEKLIQPIIKKYNFIRLISTENKGAAAARKLGLSMSRSKYIHFCDADDYLSEGYLNFITKYTKFDHDLIYFNSTMVSESGQLLHKKVNFTDECQFKNPTLFVVQQIENDQWTSAAWTYIFKREIYKNTNAHFSDRKAHEDHLFTLTIVLNSNDILVVPEDIYFQVFTIGSLTNSKKNSIYLSMRLEAFTECINYIRNRNFQNNLEYEYTKWSIRSWLDIYKQVSLFQKIQPVVCLFSYAIKEHRSNIVLLAKEMLRRKK